MKPWAVVSDGQGRVYETENFEAVGRRGNTITAIESAHWIPLPPGSQLMELPGRKPVGLNLRTDRLEVIREKAHNQLAVAAFVAPAYTLSALAAWNNQPQMPRLPLYAYGAVGWFDGRFWTTALRIDDDIRQDPPQFNSALIQKRAKHLLQKYPQNRLNSHLIHNCAQTYHCPAALNYLLNRWEMPLPTSQTCNAGCIGCISLQKESGVCSSQFRIDFTPTAAEIAEIAVDHLESAPQPVVSFGQGCEGEPLMNGRLLAEAISAIRSRTAKGTINLNTNASLPQVIGRLREVGLNSMRVSMNSAREEYYRRYFRPRGYDFQDVLTSIRVMKQAGGFVSVNLFVYPGFTDQATEVDAIERLIVNEKIDMIQWRNLNMDADWYWDEMQPSAEPCCGIPVLIDSLHRQYPHLRHGYFNPYLGAMATKPPKNQCHSPF